ncbi:MAG: 1-acyl-sn-glycerol-3-phosphate acyltransferase [Planctomycetota bacterium]|nr:MAG: 1-acyl-sn-glycerol-3-phosphate acyltransferase [Planctomycetota bacterium]REJ98537.1 MAG: 1-acyl-sn-glycerol-3-phosphate acyltransferase [Planctomycetota bacterium]REK29837.1 MAG: 1-acyl-sn-glycerol-3-phosphate acyltransferase [Planctomycetota bacterium]REK47992.1 MAG: 1-acyl-sn-glycerol-3-phosphate acyltransferase [Planctomycetota bacterium]
MGNVGRDIDSPLHAMSFEQLLSLSALLLLAAALVAWAVAAQRRSPYKPVESLLFLASVFFTRIMWRTEVEGKFPIPPDDGAVIVCNHGSSIDPFFIQLSTGRVVHWMVAREFTDFPLFRPFFRATQSIPTNRAGIDTAATKLAIRYASEGRLVGMLPEGKVNLTGKLLTGGRPGAALVALRARVPVVPCYIDGAPFDGTFWGCFLMTAHVRVKIGHPLDLSSYFDRVKQPGVLQEVTLLILREIAALAGHPDFQPELAGRRWKPGMEDDEPPTDEFQVPSLRVSRA